MRRREKRGCGEEETGCGEEKKGGAEKKKKGVQRRESVLWGHRSFGYEILWAHYLFYKAYHGFTGRDTGF